MGKEERIRSAHFRAALTFKQIQKIKKDGLERIMAELDNLLTELKKKGEFDSETAEVLMNVYLSQKSEVENMEDRMGQKIESVVAKFKASKDDGKNKILLTLSRNGDLSRNSKEKLCYPMGKSGLRINIIRFLMDQENFVPGKNIAKIIDRSYETTTSTIRGINTASRNYLNLPVGKSNDLIISRDRGGYKTNSLYPIEPEL